MKAKKSEKENAFSCRLSGYMACRAKAVALLTPTPSPPPQIKPAHEHEQQLS